MVASQPPSKPLFPSWEGCRPRAAGWFPRRADVKSYNIIEVHNAGNYQQGLGRKNRPNPRI
ncbi:MAG: hypothetical protein LBM98_02685 [Oscillospiraceae bacterium]|nr:hypothetical protein [Oscillospiraceae bacterium]